MTVTVTDPDDVTTEAVPDGQADTVAETTDTAAGAEGVAASPDANPDAETFPREFVEKLRQENGKYRERYRERAEAADVYAQRLHLELVKSTGRLADPTDLDYAEEHLDDPDALAAAIDDLLARKPHLASRKPVGDIGQGNRGSSSEPFSLLGLLKQRV